MSQCVEEPNCCGISRQAAVRHCLTISCVAISLVVVATAFEGRFGFEKSLTALVMPVGFVWLNLTGIVINSWLGNWRRIWCVALSSIWVLMSAITTSPLPDKLFSQCEVTLDGEFRPAVDAPLDLVVVFGGGTKLGPNRPEVADAGDRLVYAAQLYHGGHAKRLLATGEGADIETVAIWKALAIPTDKISTIEGRNTFQEISNLVEWLEQQKRRDGIDALNRIGILSSAYHLPRVQRLAHQAGLTNVIPVAAHHRLSPKPYTVLDFIPSLGPLGQFSDFQRELMGRIAGR